MIINVLKFGGTSMNDHTSWKQVLEIIRKYEHPVVVVSATARTTRQLILAAKQAAFGNLTDAKQIAQEIKDRHITIVEEFLAENPHEKYDLIAESCFRYIDNKISTLDKFLEYTAKKGILSPEMQDGIAAIGEQITSYLLAQCGLAFGILTQHIDARKIIKTDAVYGKANPNKLKIAQRAANLETVLESGLIPVIGGFYGEAPDGTITTLGFEGSDYTASLIGGAISASSIEIWTDVSGVYTSDPRFIKNAKPIAELSYFDATEMACFGAKVLHPSTLKPAQERNIPVFVKNIFEPAAPGTKIIRESAHTCDVLAMSFKDEMALLTISAYETVMGYSFLTSVFEGLKKYGLSVDAVNTTEASVTMALFNHEKLDDFSKEMIEVGMVKLEQKKGLISLIGCSISRADEFIARIFSSMKDENLDMITFTKEKRIFSFVVDEDKLIETAQNLHTALF